MSNLQSAPPTVLKPTGKMYLSADQENISQFASVKVALDTIHSDFEDGIEDTENNRIKPGVPGFYSVVGHLIWNNTVADKQYNVYIYKNGAAVKTAMGPASIVGELSMVIIDELKLSATDYVELWVWNGDDVSTTDIKGFLGYTSLTVQRVR